MGERCDGECEDEPPPRGTPLRFHGGKSVLGIRDVNHLAPAVIAIDTYVMATMQLARCRIPGQGGPLQGIVRAAHAALGRSLPVLLYGHDVVGIWKSGLLYRKPARGPTAAADSRAVELRHRHMAPTVRPLRRPTGNPMLRDWLVGRILATKYLVQASEGPLARGFVACAEPRRRARALPLWVTRQKRQGK